MRHPFELNERLNESCLAEGTYRGGYTNSTNALEQQDISRAIFCYVSMRKIVVKYHVLWVRNSEKLLILLHVPKVQKVPQQVLDA